MRRELIGSMLRSYLEETEQKKSRWMHAAEIFHEAWNLGSSEPEQMWKEAMAGTGLKSMDSSPVDGIRMLLSMPMEADFVKMSFRQLLRSDEGNLENRSERIETFISRINTHIDAYIPNGKFYYQDQTAVIAYLALMQPEQNFRYQRRAALEWAAYLGKKKEEPTLSSYYEICEEIMRVLKAEPEIGNRMDVKDEAVMHLLTGDFIVWAQGRNELKRSAKEIEEAIEREHRREELLEEERELSERLKKAAERKAAVLPDAIRVRHKKFGSGTGVIAANGTLEVDFGRFGRKSFQFPAAVEKGFLKLEEELAPVSSETETEIEALKKALAVCRSALERIEALS